jgi:hypothetical protein
MLEIPGLDRFEPRAGTIPRIQAAEEFAGGTESGADTRPAHADLGHQDASDIALPAAIGWFKPRRGDNA